MVDGLDWWAGVDSWIGGLVEWKLAAWGSEACEAILARATAMGRRIMILVIIMIRIISIVMIFVIVTIMIITITMITILMIRRPIAVARARIDLPNLRTPSCKLPQAYTPPIHQSTSPPIHKSTNPPLHQSNNPSQPASQPASQPQNLGGLRS